MAGDECVKEWKAGVPQLAESQARSPVLLPARTKQANAAAESSGALPFLSLKSSLIPSAAEQCLTEAHNHFMAQI